MTRKIRFRDWVFCLEPAVWCLLALVAALHFAGVP